MALKDFTQYNARELEAEVLSYWEERKIPAKLASKREGKKRFFLLDGPPYINADPHVGHVKTTACKDIWSRLKYMQGYNSVFQAGFDCHGLPVEVMVEKELGITSKRQIYEMGIGKFDAACLAKILNNEKTWMAYYRLLGSWRAYFEPYFTYKPYYIESAWWTFRQLYESGFVVQGMRSTHWCPHCETALSGYEVSDSYAMKSDPSVFIKFRLKRGKEAAGNGDGRAVNGGGEGRRNEFFLVWTTTPWTLAANVALAVAPRETYVRFRANSKRGQEYFIMAEKLLTRQLKENLGLTEVSIVEKLKGSDLAGVEYEPVIECEAQKELDGNHKARRVCLSIPVMTKKKYRKHVKVEETAAAGATATPGRLQKKGNDGRNDSQNNPAGGEGNQGNLNPQEGTAIRDSSIPTIPNQPPDQSEFEEFVTMNEGTGIVHCAPGHGATDYLFGKHYGLPSVSPVNEQGKYTGEVGRWEGKFVKGGLEQEIIDYLDQGGKLAFATKITHSYPLCWRCKTPLLFRMSEQIYLTIEPIKEKMLRANESVKWMPGFGEEAFGNWVAGASDWCISQQRFWGIPIPLWNCGGCGAKRVIASAEELAQASLGRVDAALLTDLHRHTVDAIRIKCLACGGEMARIPDIFNVWVDSGIAPWASLGYPYRNKQFFLSAFPVDLVDESQDQVRGWFYALMFLGMAVFNTSPYTAVGMMGWVTDEKGEKMSKSLGNVVPAMAALDKLGADALRLYFCWDTAPWDVQKFSFTNAAEVTRSLNILFNAYAFYATYSPSQAAARQIAPDDDALTVEDKWLLSRLHSTTEECTMRISKFEFHHVGRSIVDFITKDFSRWYIKLVRDRMAAHARHSDRAICAAVIRHTLLECCKLLAPITPFISEYLFLKLQGPKGGESVHFESYPPAKAAFIDKELEGNMAVAVAVTEAAGALRQEGQVKLRWPLRELVVTGDRRLKNMLADFLHLLRSQNNVLVARYGEDSPSGPAFKSKVITVGEGEGEMKVTVHLDTAITPELKKLAMLREVSRAIQASRKQNGFVVKDRIRVTLYSAGEDWQDFFAKNTSELGQETGASSAFVAGKEDDLKGDYSCEVNVPELGRVLVKYSKVQATREELERMAREEAEEAAKMREEEARRAEAAKRGESGRQQGANQNPPADIKDANIAAAAAGKDSPQKQGRAPGVQSDGDSISNQPSGTQAPSAVSAPQSQSVTIGDDESWEKLQEEAGVSSESETQSEGGREGPNAQADSGKAQSESPNALTESPIVQSESSNAPAETPGAQSQSPSAPAESPNAKHETQIQPVQNSGPGSSSKNQNQQRPARTPDDELGE
ncbi:isoleucine--tRNA ligase [Candidatus Micrarchaeota archaeon]|nr:isoleucine--tRNA ligase [Candidatus Micrarchaeota archaeon]